MKTLKITETELNILKRALGEFELGVEENWENAGYSKAEVKAFYNLRQKAKGTPVPDINEVWNEQS